MLDPEVLNRLYRYAFTLEGNEADAYDLLHDGIERFLRSGQQSVKSPEAFARKIIRNRFIDRWRKRKADVVDLVEDLESTAVDISASSLETVSIARVELERIWPQLEPIDREILLLWAVEGCSTRELAEELGLPRGTVLSRIHRLRERLGKPESCPGRMGATP